MFRTLGHRICRTIIRTPITAFSGMRYRTHLIIGHPSVVLRYLIAHTTIIHLLWPLSLHKLLLIFFHSSTLMAQKDIPYGSFASTSDDTEEEGGPWAAAASGESTRKTRLHVPFNPSIPPHNYSESCDLSILRCFRFSLFSLYLFWLTPDTYAWLHWVDCCRTRRFRVRSIQYHSLLVRCALNLVIFSDR